jgi:pyruvate,water dikinase
MLRDADERCGAKSAALAVLLREGFAVPHGVVVHPQHDRWNSALIEALVAVGPGPYAVRSSAAAEDGPQASFAGQFRTTLDILSTADVLAAVERTALSGRAPGLASYLTKLGVAAAEAVVPVLVQQMVPAEAAGVLFTRHPVTGGHECVIEAIDGIGDRVVEGAVTPERWVVDREATIREHASAGRVLSEQQARHLAALGRRIETVFGTPQDIEWAIADGEVWILQSRPVTALGCDQSAVEPRVPDRRLAIGTPASPGRAVGAASVVVGLDDFATFSAGDVLVCRATSPAWTPLLARATAVVTETGGVLSHAAIVAREFGIPAVVGAHGATDRLVGRGRVLVDGFAGIVAEPPTDGDDR